jgi:hypothetical protein
LIRDLIVGNNLPFNEDFITNKENDNKTREIQDKKGIQRIEIEKNPAFYESKKQKLNLCKYMCSCYLKNNKKRILAKYDLYRNFYNSNMDLFNYFKLNHYVNIFKKLMLNKNQREVLKLVYPKLKMKKSNKPYEDNITTTELGTIKVKPIKSLNLNDEKTKLLFSMLEKNVQQQLI